MRNDTGDAPLRVPGGPPQIRELEASLALAGHATGAGSGSVAPGALALLNLNHYYNILLQKPARATGVGAPLTAPSSSEIDPEYPPQASVRPVLDNLASCIAAPGHWQLR